LTSTEKYSFIKGDLKKIPKTDIDWVYVMVDVNDFSNVISIRGKIN